MTSGGADCRLCYQDNVKGQRQCVTPAWWPGPVPPLRPCLCSIVHLCLRKADQKLVILKQIPVEQMSKDERLAAQNECQVLKLLSHPNVIEYYENFLEDKALMIAMEYAPGVL